MKSFFVFASMTLALVLSPMTSEAQTTEASAFGDSQAVVEIDLTQFRSTALGKKVMSYAQEQAVKAIEETHNGESPKVDDLIELLGFNPFEEIRGAVIAINDFENPEKNLVAIIQLGRTTGNIEGLLLGLPGYESEKAKGVTIHSAEFEGRRMYAAIHTKGKNKAIAIAPDKSRLLSALGQVNGSLKMVGASSSKKPFVSVSINKLPAEMIGDGPQANVAKLIESIELTVAEDGDQLAAELAMTTDDSEHAEQIRQMAVGLRAMLGFAISQNEDDEDLKRVVELAKGLEVTAEGKQFNAAISIPVELALDFLRDEAGLDF